ncbi:hypothetical protein FRUB_04797 [Fimbriiglobus ruber]|uniref:Putative Flp pilus-assembly TadG-like N-terminal domain-containing protein n=2 Tax=Fimbriiglobus ruber TaxID=1908690 RepID=A0A225DX57_9BACT|nr:hypothetical protein FRUB_04797 [Fimbriiglobus ruber]
MLAVFITSLFAFVALAVDLGILTVARSNCQNAADAAALSGARTLDNKPTSVNNNAAAAMNNAVYTIAGNGSVSGNSLLNTGFATSNVTSVQVGLYTYSSTAGQFSASGWSTAYVPSGGGQPSTTAAPATDANGNPAGSWTAVQVAVQGSQPTFFGKIFGTSSLSTNAVAVAVHRPRDIAMSLDFTGSMGFGSLISTAQYYSNANQVMNDPNAVYPQFSNYYRYTAYQTSDPTASQTGAASTRPHPFRNTTVITNPSASSPGQVYSPANLTITTPNGPPIVQDFFYDPSNISSPTTSVATTTMSNLVNAFQNWSPTQTSAGTPDSYIGPTFTYGGYNAFDTTGTSGPLPAPDNFQDQSDLTGIPYVGDKFPRKAGAMPPTGALTASYTWDVTKPNGAAVTLAEYLGWTAAYSSGSSLPSTIPTIASGRSWTNFRDANWETYGYDMNVSDYYTNVVKPGTTDPRTTVPTNTVGGKAGQVQVTPGQFQGYSMGPQYWGKTFMIWPPDPRTPSGNPGGFGQANPTGYVPGDWRLRYFYNSSGGTLANPINPKVVNASTSTGAWYPSTAPKTNYAAVLKWIKSGPMVLPPNLRSGRVLYYSSIPDTTTSSGGDSSAVAADKKFWQDYIDFVLTNSAGQYLGDYETAGWPDGVTPSVSTTTLTAYKTDPVPYMNYMDNPCRPRGQGWFGPMTMMAFLECGQNHTGGLWSGTTHQAQCWQLKVGVNSVISDVRNNHPNDFFGLAFFTATCYKSLIVPSGQDYTTLSNALFFPRSIMTQIPTNPNIEISAYTSTGENTTINSGYNLYGDIPNAQSSTDWNSGMCMAFNLLSPNPTASQDGVNYTTAASVANRQGRRGASKIVVFETDGIPNFIGTWNYKSQGYNSYYAFGSTGSGQNTPSLAAAPAVTIVKQLVAQVSSSSSSGTSGYSLPNTPARVYTIGYGDIFSDTVNNANTTALSGLLSIQQAGNTSAATDTTIPTYQIITGDYNTRISNLQNGLSRIFQSGVQVTLIQ